MKNLLFLWRKAFALFFSNKNLIQPWWSSNVSLAGLVEDCAMRLPAQHPLNIIPGLISAPVMQNILRLSELAPYSLARGVDVDVWNAVNQLHCRTWGQLDMPMKGKNIFTGVLFHVKKDYLLWNQSNYCTTRSADHERAMAVYPNHVITFQTWRASATKWVSLSEFPLQFFEKLKWYSWNFICA